MLNQQCWFLTNSSYSPVIIYAESGLKDPLHSQVHCAVRAEPTDVCLSGQMTSLSEFLKKCRRQADYPQKAGRSPVKKWSLLKKLICLCFHNHRTLWERMIPLLIPGVIAKTLYWRAWQWTRWEAWRGWLPWGLLGNAGNSTGDNHLGPYRVS